MLILMAGLPGTGKTTIATELAQRLNAVILSKDIVRHALFPPDLVEYSTEQDDFVIDILLQAATYIWSRHPEKAIILDGRTFSRASQRHHAIQFAKQENQECLIVECVCPDDIAKKRLGQADPNHPAANRTPALYDEVKSRWEPIAEDLIVVRTDQPIDFNAITPKLIP